MSNRGVAALAAGAILWVLPGVLWADATLPDLFSDHMVLARTAKVPIWGRADPGEGITATIANQTVRTTAGADGKWRLELDLQDSPPGPFDMTVQARNTIRIGDVVVGEVWLAGGQSNMELPMKRLKHSAGEVLRSANPLLRQFEARKFPSQVPAEECEGFWSVAGPGTTVEFSALGYYFGKAVQRELGVPVGIVKSCWGGSAIAPWTSLESLATVPAFDAALQESRQEAAEKMAAFRDWLRKTGREDRAAGDPAVFTTGPVSDGWVPVKSAGKVSAPGLPEHGAIWFRKEAVLASAQWNTPQVLEFPPAAAFDRVYWDGKLLGETGCDNYAGDTFVRRYFIPAALTGEGTHVLAARMFSPVVPAGFSWPPHVGATILAGPWQAKAEYALPPLESAIPPQAPRIRPQQAVAGNLFNGMIHPLIPYAISGVIWYQGEANAPQAYNYRTAFPLLIQDWRRHWGQGDFPFYYCQLANFRAKQSAPGESDWAELREAQHMTLSVPNTGEAVLIDAGEAGDIHPQDKETAGERLAKIALARTYGRPVPYTGPQYQSMKIEGGKIRLSFTNGGGGLVARDLPATYVVKTQDGSTAPLVRNSPHSQLEGFAICGEDKKWVWAGAQIDGDTVLVWAEAVPAPVAVRYAWADNPTCNLYNQEGLPAPPFRTDDFPCSTRPAPE